jgi:outer membrane protein assembly factor BamB
VSAVRESDGHILWSKPTNVGDESSPAVTPQGVYVSFKCHAYAFDPLSGSQLWHHDEGCTGGGGRTPVAADGHVLVRESGGGPNSVLSASTGAIEGSISADAAPAVANGVAYMLSGSTLEAVGGDGLGSTNWTFGGVVTAPIVVGGLVFVGSSGGNLYALDATTGATSWSTNIGVSIPGPDEVDVSQPLTGLGAANGTLVVSAGSTLVAYRTAGAITTVPANESPPTVEGTAALNENEAADVGIW